MSSLQIRDAIKGSIAIGKGEQGPVGPVGPQGPIGDNNVCIGLSPTLEAEIWFDANDDDYSDVIVTQSEIKDFKENVNNSVSEFETGVKLFKENIAAENLAFKNEIDDSINSYKTDVDSSITSFKNNINSSITSFKNEVNNSNETFKSAIKEGQENFIETVNKDIFEDSKIDFFGKEHDKLEYRLNADFDNVHQRINESELLPYEGCSIKADNSYYGLQKDTVIKGRTLQNVLHEGMFDEFKPECWVATSQSSYWSFNDGYITIKSNPGNYVNVFSKINEKIKPNTTYTIFLEVKENTLTSETSDLMAILSDGTAFTKSLTSKDLFDVGIHAIKVTTVSDITTTILLRTFIYGHVSGGSVTFRYMILEGDHTQTPIEELPYIEGIEGVGDKSKNLCDNNDFEQGTVDVGTGVNTNSDFRVRSGFIKVEPNTTYMLTTPNDLFFRSFISYDVNKNFVRQLTGLPLTTNSNERFLKLILSKNGDNEVIKAVDVHDVQLEKGATKSSYKPYYDGYKISGKSIGKNLFKITDTYEKSDGGLSLKFDKGNQSIIVNGIAEKNDIYIYMNKDYPWEVTNNNIGYHTLKIHELCGSYKFVSNTSGNYFAMGVRGKDDSTKTYINLTSLQKFNTGAILSNVGGSSWFRLNKGVQFDNFTFAIQLEENTSPTPYEPYKETNYSYILNEPLRSLPNGVCDEIDLTTGVLTRRIGELTLKGVEDWGNGGDLGNDIYRFSLPLKEKQGTLGNGLSNIFIYQANYNIAKEHFYVADSVYVFINKSRLTGTQKTDFKQWLQNNPLTVCYELKSPTTEQLTPQQLKSFDTTTHIISENKLMPIVSTKIPSNVQAIISTLKLENSDLKNNVEVLTLENEELKSVNNVQDEMIDINMLASDELYTLIEPLLVDMLSERGVSKLVDMYVAMVQRGLKTLDEVPARYREQVREILEALEK